MNNYHIELLNAAADLLRIQQRAIQKLGALVRKYDPTIPSPPVELPGESGPEELALQLEDVARLLRPGGPVS